MSIASRGGLGEDGVKIFNCQRVADKIYFSYETEKFNFIPETTFGKSGTLNGNFPPSPEYPYAWIKKGFCAYVSFSRAYAPRHVRPPDRERARLHALDLPREGLQGRDRVREAQDRQRERRRLQGLPRGKRLQAGQEGEQDHADGRVGHPRGRRRIAWDFFNLLNNRESVSILLAGRPSWATRRCCTGWADTSGSSSSTWTTATTTSS